VAETVSVVFAVVGSEITEMSCVWSIDEVVEVVEVVVTGKAVE